MSAKKIAKKAPPAGRKATKSDTRETLEEVEIPIPISGEELAKFSSDFVKKSLEVDAHVDEKRRYLSAWREAHDEMKDAHDELRAIVTDKAKPKLTKCLVHKDFDRGVVKYLHPKTRAVLHQRDITKEDEQLQIEGTEPKRTGGPVGSDKPPAGEAGKKLLGTTRPNDVELPPATPPPMWDGKAGKA
jgi:hypothetical protein